MMEKRLILLLFKSLFLFNVILSAQIDSNYIEGTDHRFLVGMSVVHRNYEVLTRGGSAEQARFANGAIAVGARIKYRRVGISLAIPILRTDQNKDREGQNFLLRVNAYPSNFIVESSVRYAKGFDIVFGDAMDHSVFDSRMTMWQGDLAISYPLSNQRFSLRSSFRFMDRQLQSQGSMLLSATANYQKLYTESSLTSFANLKGNDLRSHHMTGLGVGLGYGYTYVQNSLFFTGVTLANLGVQRISLRYQERVSEFGIRPDITFRIACGFNNRDHFFGIQAYHRFNLMGPDIYRSRFESFNAGFTMGMRITEPRILRQYNSVINRLLAIPKKVFTKNRA